MKHIIKQFFQQEAHPIVQFIKYGIAGGVATVVQIFVFYSLSIWVFPCLTDGDMIGDVLARWLPITPANIPDDTRALLFAVNTAIGFIFSNLACYIINILWVFKRGRHHWIVELLMFYAVSGFSLTIGTLLGSFSILIFGLHTTYSFLLQMFASLMINYVCRKYIIFKG